MKTDRYTITSLEFDYADITDEKNIYLANILFSIIEHENIYLFEYNPHESTFIDELSDNYKYHKVSKKEQYLYTTQPIQLTKQLLLSIIEDSSFYLGRLAIVLSELNDKSISLLAACWKDERSLAGLKMIRMDYDGLFLFFYNMEDNESLQKILLKIDKK